MKHYEKPVAQLIKLSIEEDLLVIEGNTSLTENPFGPEGE